MDIFYKSTPNFGVDEPDENHLVQVMKTEKMFLALDVAKNLLDFKDET